MKNDLLTLILFTTIILTLFFIASVAIIFE